MKKVLLDLRDINHVTCGFGQIAKNYAKLYSRYSLKALSLFFFCRSISMKRWVRI